MLELSEIIEKLKDIISESTLNKKVFDKDVATALNIPQSTFATMKKRNSIPYQEILEFCATKKISLNWLFFDQAVDMLKEETDKFFQVRYFANIRASAGGGSEVWGESYEVIKLNSRMVGDISGTGRKDLDAIHILGDSMEPTLAEGSVVFVDREDLDISKKGIFIASTPSGLFIKRIREIDDMIELISDNKIYPPELLYLDEVIIIGKVVGNIESVL